MAISMLKIRRPLGRLIFNMGIAIPGKTVFLIETAPRTLPPCWMKDTTYCYDVSITNNSTTCIDLKLDNMYKCAILSLLFLGYWIRLAVCLFKKIFFSSSACDREDVVEHQFMPYESKISKSPGNTCCFVMSRCFVVLYWTFLTYINVIQ